MKFLKENWPIILIVIIGVFFRLYKYDQLFMYNHDNDLASWVVKDIVVDKHFRLIGQETSTQGIFIGAFFYYLQIPFYLITKMDPMGATFLGAILGAFYILGIYFILSKVFSKKTALIGALVYSLSFVFIFNDREIVPTQPVIFWSFAMFFALSEILKGNIKRGLTICAALLSLVWHLNFALMLVLPLIPISLIFSKKKMKLSDVVVPVCVFIFLSLPLFYFELRHSFVQTKAFIASMTTNQHDIISGWDKVVSTYHLISKNYYSILLPSVNFLNYEHVMLFFVALYLYLLKTLKEHRKVLLLMLGWFIVYFLFFAFYSKRVSEYYLSGIQFIPVVLLSLVLGKIIKTGKYKLYGFTLVVGLMFLNIYRFSTFPINRSGYLERKAAVSEISRDALSRGYPCVSVSYITNPGYDLGYRYFFWLKKLHVNHPDSGAPVYTIVFPLNDKLFPVGKTFGAIGLIYPDYSRYTRDGVEKSCSGENSNLTDPMFGFTK